MRIEQGARIIVENWLHAQPEDVVHFITDETKLREAEAFTHAVRQVGAIPKLTILPSDSVQAGDSIEQMRNIMSYATSIVGATNYSFITTNAVDYALHHGARFLSLPLSTNNGASLLEQDFLKMDPALAARMGRPMLRCLRSSDTVHITTKLGTDITFSIRGREPGISRDSIMVTAKSNANTLFIKFSFLCRLAPVRSFFTLCDIVNFVAGHSSFYC